MIFGSRKKTRMKNKVLFVLSKFSLGMACAVALCLFPHAARTARAASIDESPIERLAIWCEFMPYADVEPCLPALAAARCDLILHVERESLQSTELANLLHAAARAGIDVDLWMLLPYEEHLYVGQASLAATRALAMDVVAYLHRHRAPARAFVMDCEPSPLLGRELFAAVTAASPRQLVRVLRDQLDPAAFRADVATLNTLLADLRASGYAVDGAANRAFLDAQSRGNVALEDALNAPVSGISWNALSFITYRYRASALTYLAMLSRYATLAHRLYGPRAAIDIGLIGDYVDIPENQRRAELFGGQDLFYSYLRGMHDTRDLQDAVSVALACGVRRINLYALDGAVTSVAGLESWLAAARRARPASFFARWTPLRSLQAAALGALTEKGFRWFTGGSIQTHGPIQYAEP